MLVTVEVVREVGERGTREGDGSRLKYLDIVGREKEDVVSIG